MSRGRKVGNCQDGLGADHHDWRRIHAEERKHAAALQLEAARDMTGVVPPTIRAVHLAQCSQVCHDYATATCVCRKAPCSAWQPCARVECVCDGAGLLEGPREVQSGDIAAAPRAAESKTQPGQLHNPQNCTSSQPGIHVILVPGSPCKILPDRGGGHPCRMRC